MVLKFHSLSFFLNISFHLFIYMQHVTAVTANTRTRLLEPIALYLLAASATAWSMLRAKYHIYPRSQEPTTHRYQLTTAISHVPPHSNPYERASCTRPRRPDFSLRLTVALSPHGLASHEHEHVSMAPLPPCCGILYMVVCP